MNPFPPSPCPGGPLGRCANSLSSSAWQSLASAVHTHCSPHSHCQPRCPLHTNQAPPGHRPSCVEPGQCRSVAHPGEQLALVRAGGSQSPCIVGSQEAPQLPQGPSFCVACCSPPYPELLLSWGPLCCWEQGCWAWILRGEGCSTLSKQISLFVP